MKTICDAPSSDTSANLRRLTKAERETVRAMFDGRCAYCGCDLPPRWHVDHVEAVERVPTTGFYDGPWKVTKPELHHPGNWMPACPPCNIDKHRMDPQRWKTWLAVRLGALKKTPGYKLLSAHGLVTETNQPLTFLYEREPAAGKSQDGAPPQTTSNSNGGEGNG